MDSDGSFTFGVFDAINLLFQWCSAATIQNKRSSHACATAPELCELVAFL